MDSQAETEQLHTQETEIEAAEETKLKIQLTYGNGHQVEYNYNNYGSVSSIKKGTAADGTSTKYAWSYTNTNTPWRHMDYVNGLTHLYRYDSIGRMIQTMTNTTSSGAAKYETQFGYDKNNNVNKVVNGAGGRTTTSYYSYGEDNLPARSTYGRTLAYNFDAINRLNRIDFSFDAPLTINYLYWLSERNTGSDETYRTTKIRNEFIGLKAFRYSYDKLGNLIQIEEGKRADQTVTSGSGYAVKVTYEYDNLGQLTRENNVYKNKSTVYTYDKGGNITSKKEYAYTTGTVGTATATNSYSYGDSNWKDKLSAYNGKAITYDSIGNPLSYKGFAMSWEGRQLKTISGNGISSGSFKYDANGLRSQKKIGSVTSEYKYVGSQLFYEKRGELDIYYYYDSLGNPSRISYYDADGKNSVYYLICNSRGDVEYLYGASGTFYVRYIYDAWGNPISVQNASGAEITDKNNVAHVNPFRYRGYYYDSETGLYYLQSRYYDPGTGRFLNADGILLAGTIGAASNLFAYCFNNPVNFSDPSGFCPQCAHLPDVFQTIYHQGAGAGIRQAQQMSTLGKTSDTLPKSTKNISGALYDDTEGFINTKLITYDISYPKYDFAAGEASLFGIDVAIQKKEATIGKVIINEKIGQVNAYMGKDSDKIGVDCKGSLYSASTTFVIFNADITLGIDLFSYGLRANLENGKFMYSQGFGIYGFEFSIGLHS